MCQKIFSVFDRGMYKDAKHCLNCGRVFTKRRKWNDCFNEVKFCSQKCREEHKRFN
ncbi:MAG: DUF2256 domain-containing protein [Candidatus Nanoarchaeia archaeon]